MKSPRLHVVLTILVLFVFADVSHADVKLPQLFSDHMVLQRNRPIPVWGQAAPDQRVKVSLNDSSQSTRANENGRWRVDLPAMNAGGPHRLIVEANDRTEIQDVLIGDVWLCSGQSNMEWPLKKTDEAKQQNAVKQAKHNRIRLFELPHMASDEPQEFLQKSVNWTPTTPDTIANFSAVGYFFGRRLLHALNGEGNGSDRDVPIGLIQSAWGGSKAEAWTSRQALNARPELRPIFKNMENVDRNRHTPTLLHNAMIRPLIPFGIRGAIWYQGESNMGNPFQYRTLFPAMIRDWRDRWGQGQFPFYLVQLAPYKYGDRGSLPVFWESQNLTHRILPRTGVAVINDIGNPDDIHPRTKQPVGERLARWALKQVYGRNILPSGPLFERMDVQNGRAVLHFKHTGEGLRTKSGTSLEEFEIAGPDRTFHQAKAHVKEDSVIVQSDEVEHPMAVRYAWDEVAEPNLVNSAGLPASSFRTDGWDPDSR